MYHGILGSAEGGCGGGLPLGRVCKLNAPPDGTFVMKSGQCWSRQGDTAFCCRRLEWSRKENHKVLQALQVQQHQKVT